MLTLNVRGLPRSMTETALVANPLSNATTLPSVESWGAKWNSSSPVMRSVTWRNVSSTVAPGQAAWTTIVLMTKAGSSSRPRLRNDAVPASITTIIRYTTNEWCRRAQSDMLKFTRSQPEQADCLARMQDLDAGRDHDVPGLQPVGDHDCAGIESQQLDVAQ